MSEVNAADATVDVNKLDRMFLAMALLDPRGALKSYGISAPEDMIIALENAAEGELQHWHEVLKEVTGARGNFCQFCNNK